MDPHDLKILAYTSISLFSIVISIGTGIYSLRRRSVTGAGAFSLVLFLEAAWTIGFLFEALAVTLPGKIFWDNLQWIASFLLPLALLSFAMQYTGRAFRHPVRAWLALSIIPVLSLLLIFTNAWHGLAIHSIRLIVKEPFSEYSYEYGRLLYVGIIYLYLVTLAPLSFFIGLLSRHRGVYRIQALIIFAGFFTPVLGTIITLFGIRLWEFRDFSPVTFAISNLLIAVGLYRYRIFNLLPLARDLVIDSMEDGMIVLDLQKQLADINQAAKGWFDHPRMTLTGLPLEALAVSWLQEAELHPGMAPIHREISIPGPAGDRALDLRISYISGRSDTTAGYLILMRDISDRKRADALQQAAYTDLEHQVAERTAQLSRTVRRLEEEIAQRQNAEEALRRKTENLSAVGRLAIQLSDSSAGVEIIPLVAEFVKEVTGALGVIVSIFDPETSVLSIKTIATQNRLLKKTIGFFPDLQTLRMRLSVEDRQRMISRLVGRHTQLSEVTFGAMPEGLSRQLMKMLKIGEMVSATLQVDGDLYGSIMIFLPTGAPSPEDEMLGAFAHVAAVAMRRRQAEEALRASEVRFRTLLENSNDLIAVLDAEGNQLFSYNTNTDSRSRVLGYPPEVMITRNVMEFIDPDDLPLAKEIYERILAQPGNHELFELRYRHMDGSCVILETYAKNMLDNPLIGGIVSTSRDVTERKRAQEEQRRLNRTLAMISECNLALVRMDDELILLETICRIIVETGGHRFAWINYLEEKPVRRFVPLVYYGVDEVYGAHLSAVANDLDRPWGEWVDGEPPDFTAERRQMEAGLLEIISRGQPDVVNDIYSFPYPLHREESLRQGVLSMIALPLRFGGELYGSLHINSSELGAFDPKEVDLLSEMAHDVSFGIHARRMRTARDQAEREAYLASSELNKAYEATLEGWSRALELRERETAGHSQRVVDLTLAIAAQMGFTWDDCIHIRRGALLHDIGKMGIPDSILLKPAKLTPEDWEIMRQHPVFARDLLSGIPYLEPALVIPYYHHERWDGSGYPQGLTGEEIPLPARIFAVVDVWDALGWDRPYRKAWPENDIFRYLSENAGVLFDPRVVQLFLLIIRQASEKTFPADQAARER